MARPTKYTPATINKLKQAITLGATYDLACKFAGISYDTLNDWMHDEDKIQLHQALKAAEGAAAVTWLRQIEAAAKDGNWQAAAWKLERRYPDQYGRRMAVDAKHEHSGSTDKPPVIVRFFDASTALATLAAGSAADSDGTPDL